MVRVELDLVHRSTAPVSPRVDSHPLCTSTCIWSGNPVHAPIITSPSPAWQQASRASTSTGEVLSAFEQSIPLSPLGVSLSVRPRGSTQFSRVVRIRSRHKEPGTSMDRTGPRRLSRSVVVPPLIAANRERRIETTGSSQRLACRTFSPPTSHVSSLRSEYGQTACRQWSARSAQPWRSRTALDRLTVSRETAGACATHSPATSSRHHRTGDEDGISKTDTVSAPTQLLCPNPAHWWREATLSRGDSLSCRGGVSQT